MSYNVLVNDGVSTYTWDVAMEIVNDPVSGTATITITPRGGRARLPGIIDGAPGLPPVFPQDLVAVEVIAPGDSVPPPLLTLVTPGGPGVASTYGVTYYVPQGETGAAETTILAATDVVGTPAEKYELIYTADTGLATGGASNSTPGLLWVPRKVGDIYTATTISATSGNGSPRQIASISIPAQLFAWRPKVNGHCVVGNAVDTHVDIYATLGTTSGDQVGFGVGVTGSTTHSNQLDWSGFGAAIGGSSGGQYSAGYGVVPAGQATTLFLMARQTASTTSAWTTPTAPQTSFGVEVSPIP